MTDDMMALRGLLEKSSDAECWERVICPSFVARQMSGLFAACSWGGTCDVNWRYGVSS